MRRFLLSIYVLMLVYVVLGSVFDTIEGTAHPGRTASDGYHYCRTNCLKWGEVSGARHCHGTRSAPTYPEYRSPRPDNRPDDLNLYAASLVRVIDGDTIELVRLNSLINRPPYNVRLANIDAPELDQPGGREAMAKLSDLLRHDKAQLIVRQITIDRYSRPVVRIYAADVEINREMVKSGWAWVYDDYNTDAQLPELQLRARERRLGIWGLGNKVAMPPWEWRSK